MDVPNDGLSSRAVESRASAELAIGIEAVPVVEVSGLWKRRDHFAGWPRSLSPMLEIPGFDTRVETAAPGALASLDAIVRHSTALVRARELAPQTFDAHLSEDVEVEFHIGQEGAAAAAFARLFRPLGDHDLEVSLSTSTSGQGMSGHQVWRIEFDGDLILVGRSLARFNAAVAADVLRGPPGVEPIDWKFSDVFGPTANVDANPEYDGSAWTLAEIRMALEEAAEQLKQLADVTQAPPYLELARAERDSRD